MSSKKLILAACEKGDLPQLRRVLEETELDVGSEPLGSEGETTLHVACAHGHLDTVQYLVNDRGCSVAVANSRAVGATPLEVAWANKHWEVVEFLLNSIQGKELFAEVGLAPTTVTQLQEVAKYGDEALHQACSHGYLEVVNFLMCSDYLYLRNEKGRDPTAVSSHGTTPLQVAWENKHWEIVSYILQAMRDFFGQASGLSSCATMELLQVILFGEDSFHVACSRGSLEVVQYLHQSLKSNLVQCNSQGKTPLDMARSNGNLYVIHYLLESGECSAPDMTELHIACMGRDEKKVRNLASDVTSLCTPDQYGITAVHYAICQPENLSILVSIAEEEDMMSLLIRQDGRGNTPLHYAASGGHTKCVKILVSYYKSINIQNSDGNTPLHLSIGSSYCNSDLVREISMHESCNPSTVNAQNETPLHIASQYGKLGSAELLLFTGKCSQEDVKVAMEAKFLLHQAVATDRMELVQTLLQVPGCNINQLNSKGETPLHVACRSDVRIFELLIADSRCDLNAQDKNGFTALHIAIASGQSGKYHLLITSVHCNPNILCSDGNAPLHMMVEENFDTSLRDLLKHPNCNPNVRNNEGNSALHVAVRKHSVACATCLLQHERIDPNIQNHNGNTPLHEVVTTKAPIEIMEPLLQHKDCNPCITNENGKTPLQIASGNRLLQYVSIFILCEKYSEEELRDAASRFRYILHYAVLLKDINMVEMMQSFLQCGVNEANEDGETPLHIACRQADNGILQVLLDDKRCDLNVQNTTGETALHVALQVCSESHSAQKVQSILHIERCNPNITNSEGQTPLHVAARRTNFQIAAMLLKHSKVDPNVQDNDGNTPLHISVSKMSLVLLNIEPFLNHESIDLSIQNIWGNTPLHEAVISKTPVDIVEALTLHKSCNPNRPNHEDMTPLQLSVDSGKMDYLEVMIASGKCSHEDIVKCTERSLLLHRTVSTNRSKLALILVAMQEYNMNETNSAGETALHVACRTRSSRDILKVLVDDSRCDLNTQTQCGDTALHLALHSGTDVVAKVQCMLQSERCNPNITNSEGYTPLHVAVKRRDFKNAIVLLNHSECNPNIQDLTGNTPLHIAVSEMSLSSVKSFLRYKNIDLNIQNREGNTPLHKAVLRWAPVDVVKALTLHKTCNPSIINNDGMTPLKMAVDFGDVDYVEVLITSGKCSHEDIVEATEGTLLLHQAVYSNQPRLFAALLNIQEFNVNRTNSAGETALHIACKMRHNEDTMVMLAEDSRCDLNAQTQCGDTALHLVLHSGTDVVAKVQCMLQSERCDPNITNSEGYTPLHVAVKRRDFENAIVLLNHSECNPNIQDLTGNTPLHIAASEMSLSIVKSFLSDKNTDLNIQNREGNTPLHKAVLRQTPVEVVEALTLHKTCNPSIINNDGMTPLKLSVGFGEVDYVEVLITSGKCSHEDIVEATEDTLLLHQAVYSNRPGLLAALLNIQELNVNRTNSAGETALHVACKMRHGKDIMKMLVEDSRCDPNAQTQCGNTALHLAVWSEQYDKVQCILQSERCNPNITNSEGHTPLHVAVSEMDFETVVSLLNHSQCNPNIQDLNGNTPLHIATSEISLSSIDIESFLNHKKIDLNIQNSEGNAPLHEAVMNQVPVDVVEALTLHNSCDLSIVNNAGKTPLQISCDIEKLNFAEVLITSGKCSHDDIVKVTEGTLLHEAVYSNRLNLVTRLLKVQDCTVNRTNSAGETALHCACKTGHGKAILETLIEDSRCDLMAQDQHGNTALHLAMCSGADITEKVHCILQSERCNPNITNSEGYTPLHVACAHGHLNIVRYLVNDRGCSVATPNSRAVGATPLEVAWANKHWEVVEFLLNAIQEKELFAEVGLAPTTVTQLQEVAKYGDEALHQACSHGYLEVVKLLVHSGYVHTMNETPSAVSSTLLQVAWENKHWEVASHLLQAIKNKHEQVLGLSPTAMTQLLEVAEFKEDAFHVACGHGSLEVVYYFHESLKCNLMRCNSQGETPLDMARSYGNLYVIHYLLESGECPPPDMTELQIACLERDEENVRNLACNITSLSTPDQYGITAVHYATYQPDNLSVLVSIAEQKNMLSLLVGVDGRGNTPLHFAALSGRIKSVKILVSHYKSVDIQNSDGDTPLHLSIKSSYGKFGLVREILQHESCNPYRVNAQNETPLQTASQCGKLDSAELLLLTGKCSPEDIKVAIEDNLLLHQAVATSRLEFVQTLLKVPGCNINEFNSDGETPLHIACRSDFRVFQLLIADSRCDLNAQNKNGLTALHIAIASGQLEKCHLLINNVDCNPNILCCDGNAPLHMMVEEKFGTSMRFLLKHSNCNPNIRNNEGNSALHLAVRKHSVTCATCLLQHDTVDPNIQNHNGNTPLHEVVMTRAPIKIMKPLLQHKKCKPCIRNESGKTPLQIASENRLLRYVSIFILCVKYSEEELIDAAFRFKYILHYAVSINMVEMLQTFLQCDVNEANEDGETPLHIACRLGGIEVVQVLVADKRCDLNIQNATGETALHIAVYSELHSVQKVQSILHSEKCNPNITNNEGQTPLHVAARSNNFQNVAMVLKYSKVDANVQDNDGNTPLHIAANEMSLSCVKSFLSDKSINLNIQNREGNTPLHKAVLRQTAVDVVEALTLHKTCNPSIINNEGMTPLKISVDFGGVDYVEVLIISGKCSHEDIVEATESTLLLHQAVYSNRPKLLAALLNIQELNVNRTNSAGETALHVACKMRHGKKDIMKMLVENNRCDPNAQTQCGNTALHFAVCSKIDVAEKVQCITRSERCNPNVTNKEGRTPLHVAVSKMEFDASVIILKHSQCNPNLQDLTGNTPLHLSISKMALWNFESFLIHDKIDLNIQNNQGETILHKAVMGKTPVNVVKAITCHKSCNPSIANNKAITPLRTAIALKEIGHVEVLITSGKCSHKDIEMSIKDKLLLHQAVFLRQIKLFLALVNLPECNVGTTNSKGETLLHVACRVRYCKTILESLVEDSRHDLNAQNTSGDTALHIAVSSESDNAEKVQCILQSERCNPNITNSEGFTPLHVAVENKQFQIAPLLLKHSKCNPNIQDINGNTPLHLSIGSMSLIDVEVFLLHKYIDLSIKNYFGDTIIHAAVLTQSPLDVVTALILHKRCNLHMTNSEGMTPLQTAVVIRKMDIAAALITSKKCSREDIIRASEETSLLIHSVFLGKADLLTALIEAGVNVNTSNTNGETALHIACKKGNSETAKLLLQNGADVLAVDCQGNAPIHVACANSTSECLSLILHHKECNPNQQNAVGNTPLHTLCSFGWICDMRMLHMLLSTPGINPEYVNHAGQIAGELGESNYSVIEMISKYLKHKNTQLETYLKMFVVGNSGGGKSTLIKAVTTERSKSIINSFKSKHVNPSEVPPHTAGIVPLSFNSKHFGHAVLYDFAGQHEYYSSHAAVMENLVLPSPPLFLLLIDISKPMDEIREELVYWWMFINNHSKRATAPPHVILVGSHKDILMERGGNVETTMEQITDIIGDIPVSFQFDHSKVFPLDCRKLVSQGLTALLTQLKLTCQTLRLTADIDLHCHILKAFLNTTFQSSVACKVTEIAERTNPEDDLLPQEPSQLIPLLSTLSDKGHILLLENHNDVNKSWVVLQPELLLVEVNGSIFAPDKFKEHCSGFAMSTGVVTLSKIHEKFGKPNNQVIIGYLIHLEFCFRIKDQHTLEMITKDATLQLTAHGSEHAEEYYFFPALVQKESPSDVCLPQETVKYECGWFYRCNEPTEQLTTRFLHVLILRLAFSCDPPDEPTEKESVVLLRSCSVWKHGIAWWTNDGIETIVEVGLQCRWVAVMLRCPDTHKVQCAELRTKVISTVLKTKQDFCPAISMKEFLIAPSSLQYPFEGRELTLYSMREIAKVVIAGKDFPRNAEGKSDIHISQLLPFEPFFNFGDGLIGNLFIANQSRKREMSRHNLFQIASKCFNKLDDFKKALHPNEIAFQEECGKPGYPEVKRCVALFQIVQRRGCKTWKDLEQELSQFSIFCGRNPMDLALGKSESRYSYEHHMRSANGAAGNKEVSEMAEKDQVSAERIESISMGSSVQESVRETGNEDDKASDQEIENDVSQEEEMEQSLEMHNNTGEREIGSDCTLNGETKGFVESSKNSHTVEDDLWRRNGEEQFPDAKEQDETWREMNGDAPREKASISLVKRLTHSGSDCPMGSEERLAGESSERKLAGERREPLDRGTTQEMDLQTKEDLQVLKRNEELPEEHPLMHTAATRASATRCERKWEKENGKEAHQTEEEERDITADKRSVEVGEGQMCQETVQGIVSTEDRKDHIDTHTATEKPVTGEKLSLKVLTNEVVPEVCSKWYLLGIQLNLSDKVLDQIEMDHPRDLDNMRCCIEMFSEWLSQDAGACWSTLVAALSSKAVAENELAAKLQGTTEHHIH